MEQTDKEMDRRMDGQIDRQTDRQTDIQKYYIEVLCIYLNIFYLQFKMYIKKLIVVFEKKWNRQTNMDRGTDGRTNG